jgi:hypothetical protein
MGNQVIPCQRERRRAMLREEKKKSMVILYFLLLISLLSTETIAAKWIQASGDKSKLFDVYYDAESIIADKDKGLIKVNVKYDYTPEGAKEFLEKINQQGAQPGEWTDFSHYISTTDFDYKNKKYRFIKMTYHTKAGKLIIEDDITMEWRDIVPGSVSDSLLNIIFKNEKIK